MPFHIDPQLERDTCPVADLPLSAVRLMLDANYPWLVLVPRRAGRVEIHDLPRHDRIALIDEIDLAGEALRSLARVDKLNVAALGNQVRQLHVHVVARQAGDRAWPKPVWGAAPARPYPAGEAEALASRIAGRLNVTRIGRIQ
ncbi:HIT domain-containing protein [Propylenella binzhouense]|uniref:HIT domain-containing protein n=1 Tax=Propylenella binzhouense TaxID=2555902 RepID=A0A964WUH1_9HYPH|nr:HIT family protein [Propylenella binzhouense]MYZ49024.1 HIT domain-containing protein [Propylenella binzhouense]